MNFSPLMRFYVSCFISAWGDRIWYFALSIYFVIINNDSLLVTALNGLIGNIATITLGPLIGSLIDKHQRMMVITIALLTQNLTVAINCCIVVVIIVYKRFLQDQSYAGFDLVYVAQAVIIFLNMVSKLASMACKISIERDWVIVIAKNAFDAAAATEEEKKKLKPTTETTNPSQELDPSKNKTFKHKLTLINSQVRRIDLFTATISPLCAGLIMSFLNISPLVRGPAISAIVFAVWNIISFVLEFSLLRSVYLSVPELEKPKPVDNEAKPVKNGILLAFEKTKNGWSDYFNQGVVLIPSLALSVLYLTVLSFDGITIGYAKSQKLSETSISIFQGVGSIMGVIGTIMFPLLHNRAKIYLPYIGFIGSIYQFSFLLACFVAIWLPGSPFTLADKLFSTHINKCAANSTTSGLELGSDISVFNTTLISSAETSSQENIERILFESPCYVYTSIVVLLGAMALSRFGLWLTDLVIHQIIQESVPENKRGLIGGVQSSLNTIFDLVKFVVVIFLSDVTQYGYLVIVSIVAVFTAFCLYTSYVVIMCARRGTESEEDPEKKKQEVDEDEMINQEMEVLA